MKWIYNLMYRYSLIPWDIGPRQELIDVIERGRIKPCRTLYFGRGTINSAVFLAEKGFEVTAVDYIYSAIELRKRALAEGLEIAIVLDNPSNLKHVSGTYEFIVDIGTLSDLKPSDRDRYLENILPHSNPGSFFFLWCTECPSYWWQQLFYPKGLEQDEAEHRFGDYFRVEGIGVSEGADSPKYPLGEAAYLMTRKVEQSL